MHISLHFPLSTLFTIDPSPRLYAYRILWSPYKCHVLNNYATGAMAHLLVSISWHWALFSKSRKENLVLIHSHLLFQSLLIDNISFQILKTWNIRNHISFPRKQSPYLTIPLPLKKLANLWDLQETLSHFPMKGEVPSHSLKDIQSDSVSPITLARKNSILLDWDQSLLSHPGGRVS